MKPKKNKLTVSDFVSASHGRLDALTGHLTRRTETPKQRVGRLVRAESGLSQMKMGDAMTFEKLIWDEALSDPNYIAWGLKQAADRRTKALKPRGRKK